MRRSGILFTVLALVLAFAATQIPAAKNSFNFFIGHKSIDDLEDIDLDSQVDFGIEMSFAGDDWPVAIAVDLLGSSASEDVSIPSYYYYGSYDVDVESTNWELDFGVRKTWEFASPVRPYFGGGIALGRGELEVDFDGLSASDDENGIGYWIGGGVYWKIGNSFNLGLNLRHSKIDVEIEGDDLDIGGTHVGLVLGWGY
jgi:opacity protein-like surface antigen